MIVSFRNRLPSDSSCSPTPCRQPAELDFTISVQLSSLTLTSVNTPLPYHLPLHPVTVTTSQPPRSALRCVPLTDSCFTFPLVLLQPKTLLVCLFNARSVGTSRRRSDISTFIQDNDIDIMLLTEIWLHPAGDEAKITDLAPPGYSALSFPRSAGGPAQKAGEFSAPALKSFS